MHRMFLNTTDDENLWSTPSIGRGGIVYVLTGAGMLYSIDITREEVKWKLDLIKCE